MIAAAIADPVVEHASNAGWLGPGAYTDHSNWDVLIAVMVGTFLIILHLVLRVRDGLAGQRLSSRNWMQQTSDALGSDTIRLTPTIFLAQIIALYLLETTEQLVVFGHLFGPTIWLGGPILISLAVHAATCVVVTQAAARLVHLCADVTLGLVQIVRAFATLAPGDQRGFFVLHREQCAHGQPRRPLHRIRERAPPFAAA